MLDFFLYCSLVCLLFCFGLLFCLFFNRLQDHLPVESLQTGFRSQAEAQNSGVLVFTGMFWESLENLPLCSHRTISGRKWSVCTRNSFWIICHMLLLSRRENLVLTPSTPFRKMYRMFQHSPWSGILGASSSQLCHQLSPGHWLENAKWQMTMM